MKEIKQIYARLLRAYGPQGWWPVTNSNGIVPIYQKRKRLTDKQKFEVMIGAMLTQNTSWDNVEKVMMQLKKQSLIDPISIMNVSRGVLTKTIKGVGYFNKKAERLKLLAQFIKQYTQKKLQLMSTDTLRELLLSQNGIGSETADSIMLYAFNRPCFVIDAYTKRIIQRITGNREQLSYESLQYLFHSELQQDSDCFNEYHALLVEHAKQCCTKKAPKCNGCPILDICKAGKSATRAF